MATEREVKAVRRVLYNRGRMRLLLTEVRSIDVLMNLDPYASLSPDDTRVAAGSGPHWFLSSGEVDPGVLEAASRCQRVAALLRDTRRELKDVDFDRADKRELRNALEEHAKAWIARADAWSRPGSPDVATMGAAINSHDAASLRSYHRVDAYLDSDAFEDVL